MRLNPDVLDSLRVRPGRPAGLAGRDPAASPTTGKKTGKARKHACDEQLEAFTADLTAAQGLLYASGTSSLLVVLQGLDAAGKDGTIKHVMSGVNPQGCQVVSFKAPSAEELAHDFLWRAARAVPESGRIGIFNRSHYEDVLVVRVHPEMLDARYPDGRRPTGRALSSLWQQRYDDINAFERHLDRSGTRIVKIFIHVSKQEQRRRLLQRLDDPARNWKFSDSDLPEHERYDDYRGAYEKALTATSTAWAPWYVVPADHKHVLRALVAGILVHTLGELDLHTPEVDPSRLDAIAAARSTLLAEAGDRKR